MNNAQPLLPKLYFSYGQFMVYDQIVKLPGLDWTDEHYDQGFARRDSVVGIRTLDDFGHADVRASDSMYVANDVYTRVIAIPFRVVTGTVVVEGPEEMSDARSIQLAPGNYRLVICQTAIDENLEAIDLYFEPLQQPAPCSEIIVRDSALNPPFALIETADIAGEE